MSKQPGWPWDADLTMPYDRGKPTMHHMFSCPWNCCAEMIFSPVDAKWHGRCGIAEKQGELLVYTEG